MIIICHTEPGYSNQLFQNAYALAYSKENKRLFFNTTNKGWSKYYYVKKPLFSLIIGALNKWRYKIPLSWQKKFKIGYINFSKEESVNTEYSKLEKHNLVFLSGWYFRHPLSQHRDYFQKRFCLQKKYYANNKLCLLVQQLKSENYIICGLHARRGDYQIWEDGKYYFDWKVYEEKKQQIKALFAPDTKLKFMVFSNEKAPEFINGHDTIISEETWFMDHHLMGMCDYLLGPPSTFTMWASFIGGAKLSFLKSAEQKIKISDFEEYYGN